MGGWNNRRWKGRRNRASDRDPRPWRPPLPPDYGLNHNPVPLWEREFCIYVGNISWQRFCENKQYVEVYNNLEHWDDSGAFENFQNAKERFRANYHGQPSDIPLPDPDMYIDIVDQDCKVDPELLAELDKIQPPVDSYEGLGNTEAYNKCTQNKSGNWDIYVEKPVQVNAWEDNSRSNLDWGAKNESSNIQGYSKYGWGDGWDNPDWNSSNNKKYGWDGGLDNPDWQGNKNYGWDDGLDNPDWQGNKKCGWGDALDNSGWQGNSKFGWDNAVNNTGWGDSKYGWDAHNPGWRSSGDNRYYSKNRNNFPGGSNNRYQDPSNMSGRKRNGGRNFQQGNNRQRSRAEDHQSSNWQDGRRRHTEWREWRQVHNRDRQRGQEGMQGVS